MKKTKTSPLKKAAAKTTAKAVSKAGVKAAPGKATTKTATKAPAKTAAKAATKKAPAKAPVASAKTKTPVAPAKTAVKKAATTAAKKVVAKKARPKAAAPAKTKAVAEKTTKAATKTVKATKAETKKTVPVKTAAPAAAKPADVKETKAAAKETKAPATKAKAKTKAKETTKAVTTEAFPALDPDTKRAAKPFFMEVKPGVERVIKRGDKSAVSQVIDLQARRKGPAAEESPEELAERIERELQSQSFMKRTPLRPQMCTKCGINEVTPRFTIDRELGYCELCAEILRLGETKEARRMEISLGVKKEETAEEGGQPDEDAPEEDIEN